MPRSNEKGAPPSEPTLVDAALPRLGFSALAVALAEPALVGTLGGFMAGAIKMVLGQHKWDLCWITKAILGRHVHERNQYR